MASNKKKHQQSTPARQVPAIETGLFPAWIPVWAASIAVVAWVAVVLLNYYKANPINTDVPALYFSLREFGASLGVTDAVNLFKYIPDLLAACFVFVSAYGFGRNALRLFAFSDLSGLEEKIFSATSDQLQPTPLSMLLKLGQLKTKIDINSFKNK